MGSLREKGVDAEVELVAINTAEEARELRFPGSPTIRVDGEDLFLCRSGLSMRSAAGFTQARKA